MHEYSIIAHLIALCEENAESANAKKINKVFIEVGERSAVEVDLLQSAFEVFKADCAKFGEDCALIIKKVPVELRCQNCNANFKANGLQYGICIECGGSEVEIVKGMELDLVRLEMEGGNDG